MKRDVRDMYDLVELGYLRNSISQRLRAWPQDAKMKQRLLAQFESRAAVERQITERVCYLVAMLAIDSVPEMFLDEDPPCWEHTEGTLEAVAHAFPDEIARLRVLILQACCRGQGEANVQAFTAWLVDTFIVGEPGR
jgi:hypothetical protein